MYISIYMRSIQLYLEETTYLHYPVPGKSDTKQTLKTSSCPHRILLNVLTLTKLFIPLSGLHLIG